MSAASRSSGGARRSRAAQMAGAETVPIRIVKLIDVEAWEAQFIENVLRRDVYKMEEAQEFRALSNLEEPKRIDNLSSGHS